MPFITSELWNNTGTRSERLINASWPKNESFDTAAIGDIDWVIELIGSIRSLRAEMNLPAGAKLTVLLKGANADSLAHLLRFKPIICSLARLEDICGYEDEITPDMVQSVFREASLLIPLKGVVDFAAERERLQRNWPDWSKILPVTSASCQIRVLSNVRRPRWLRKKSAAGRRLWKTRPKLRKRWHGSSGCNQKQSLAASLAQGFIFE